MSISVLFAVPVLISAAWQMILEKPWVVAPISAVCAVPASVNLKQRTPCQWKHLKRKWRDLKICNSVCRILSASQTKYNSFLRNFPETLLHAKVDYYFFLPVIRIRFISTTFWRHTTFRKMETDQYGHCQDYF